MTNRILASQLGNRIRDRRKSLRLSQSELAGDDLTKSFISQVEKGQATPSVQSLIRIAQRLGCTVGFLLGETEAPGVDLATLVTSAGFDPDDARRLLLLLGAWISEE